MNTCRFLIVCGLSMLGACASPDAPRSATENKPAPQQMTREDLALANQTFQKALEKSISGTSLTWRNPRNEHSGSITPQKTYRTRNGFYCRVFDETVTMTSNTKSFKNTACRDKDGVWKPI